MLQALRNHVLGGQAQCRSVVKIQLSQFSQEAHLAGKLNNRIQAELAYLHGLTVAYFAWQQSEIIVAKKEELQIGQLANGWRQTFKLVVMEAQLVNVEEIAEIFGQAYQVVVVQVHFFDHHHLRYIKLHELRRHFI